MRDEDGQWYNKHSSLWHPWQDKTGIRHVPCFHREEAIFSIASSDPMFHVEHLEKLLSVVSQNQLFVLCHDILNEHEFFYAHELIGHPMATPYLSRKGNIAALRIANKRKSGFLVPEKTWNPNDIPLDYSRLVENITLIFKLFGFESVTPASLSEKVLRATLPTPVRITRPNCWLRRDILENHVGGRIDCATPALYRKVRQFDKNKAYLFHSRYVPSPFETPIILVSPGIERAMGYAAGFWQCDVMARHATICPIQIEGRAPREGERFTCWLWSGEIQDCLECGYDVHIRRGYGWSAMSDFMCPWSDILWQKYEQTKTFGDEHLLDIIKRMMVGVPGRFLRLPERYVLVPLSQIQEGDIPLLMHWRNDDERKFTDYAIRPEEDQESTALTPQGSYIVAEMRRELFHRMREEEQHGRTIVRSYIDSYCVVDTDTANKSYRNIGSGLGQWKEEETWEDAYVEENRIVGRRRGNLDMKAPGIEKDSRVALWKQYQRILQTQSFPS